MSTIDLRFEQDVAEFDRSVVAYGLAEEGVMDRLEEIATGLGVLPLGAFAGQPLGKDAVRASTGATAEGHRPWFDAAEGRRTVSALIRYLADHPNLFPEADPDGAEEDPGVDMEPRENLAQFEAALRAADEQGVRFHLVAEA